MKIKSIALTFVVMTGFATSVLAVDAPENIAAVAEKATSLAGQASSVAETASNLAEKLVNINTADASTLANIPGVGEKIATAITKYRETNGAFTQIKDLLNIDGIDASLLEKIAPLLKL